MTFGIQFVVRTTALSILVAVLLVACSDWDSVDIRAPQTVRMGVLPDQSEERLRQRYLPLVDYLEARTSLTIEFVPSSGYADLRDKFAMGEVDFANFGGLTFTQEEARSGAEPLVMRDTDISFTSCYIVRGDDTRTSIGEFAGEPFSFGPRLSTSGHLMPRHFMSVDGISPEDHFGSVVHSQGHDQTTEWVRDGKVTLGVVNCVILEALMREERLAQEQIRVLLTTPTYGNYVWAVQHDMPAQVRVALRDAFLDLDARVPEERALLRSLGANGYLPAGSADFDDVRMAATALGLIQQASAN